MSGSMGKRLRRLERDHGLAALPWDRPGSEWTDEQLYQVLGVSADVDDAYLLGISRRDTLIFCVQESASSDEWEAKYGEARQ